MEDFGEALIVTFQMTLGDVKVNIIVTILRLFTKQI